MSVFVRGLVALQARTVLRAEERHACREGASQLWQAYVCALCAYVLWVFLTHEFPSNYIETKKINKAPKNRIYPER